MIICSKHEGNGTYREFMLDDAHLGDEVHVKTHLRHRVDGDTVATDDWMDAGIITRAPNGLKAAVRGRRKGLVSLDKLFTNEIAALQAIAVHYVPASRPN